MGQITAVGKAPFHTGRLDLLNPRSIESWAREASAAWEGSGAERAAAQERAIRDEQPPYTIRERRTCRLHDGRLEPLCNFTARITREVLIDDGAVEAGELTIEGVLDDGQPMGVAHVPLAQFGRMNWVLVQWGARARVTAGAGVKDQLREAIQALSPAVPRTRAYAHCGWRKLNGRWQWLHAAGAIGGESRFSGEAPAEAVEVQLAGNLRQVRLPVPPTGEALSTAIQASLALLDLGPMKIGGALLAAALRVELGIAGRHHRLPNAMASLLLGWDLWLRFALQA
ncbi:MAG: hypothetical protein ACRDG4_07625, partial [Chloroflexota bacterium]